MPAQKYDHETTYLLRMEKEEKTAYKAAAKDDHISMADWINQILRKELRNRARREAA
jgi:predicted HicB family RNase H-like nuclease